ncbi:MAG: diacylglycerol kinase family protein [Chitinophagales bacterium]|jgi:diacylglycerol kinase (ATP)|nr:diacylglycerol kinase family protein [Chitinophagales bacterium]
MKKLLNSFGYALKGMLEVLKTQQNMRIHAVAVLVVTVVGLFLGLTAVEWSLIALSIGGVMAAEMMNTAIEALVDLVSPQFDERAGKIKDIAAGAVLLTAIVAAVVAVYIFGNKIFNALL